MIALLKGKLNIVRILTGNSMRVRELLFLIKMSFTSFDILGFGGHPLR
jgi:hypothetical protein